MSAPSVDPGTLLIDAQPGIAGSGSVTLNLPPADPAVTATVVGDGFAVESVAVTVQVWHRYTEQEIDELPPAMREAARKAGGYWDPQTTTGDGSTPIEVPSKAQVQISVTATTASVGVASATLTITGAVWGTIEVPVYAVVGTEAAAPVVSLNPLQLICLPGDTATPSVTIGAPPPATVLATLASGSTGIAISQVTVRIPQRHDWTADELLDLPESMRAQAKKDGWIDWRDGPQGGPGVPLAAPANSLIAVDLTVTVPLNDVPDELTGTLIVLSTRWQKAEIPITVVISDFDAVPLSDRVSVQQGIESEPFGVALSSTIGPDTDVHFEVAAGDAADVSLDVQGTHLARHSNETQPLRVTVAPNAVLGNYPIYLGQSYDVGLRVTAFGGIYNRQFPLGLTLLPGTVTVAAQQGSIQGQQGATASCQLTVVVSGGLKQLTVTAGALPYGVVMAPVVVDLNGPVTTTVALSFTIAPDAPTDEVMISLSWNAGDGVNAGAISLPFTVLLTPDSVSFSQEVVTPPGTPLGGTVNVVLDNAGNGTFSGDMRATGALSYSFQLRSVVRSADGSIAVATQRSGDVDGSISIGGDSRFTWNDPVTSVLVASEWPAVRSGSLVVSHAYELTGVVESIEGLVEDWIQFMVDSALLSATGGAAAGVSAVIFMGDELKTIRGVAQDGVGGLPGVIVNAGITALVGPTILIPVLVAATAIADLGIKNRSLNAAEIALATQVFGTTVPYDHVKLTNLKGLGGVEFTVPGVGTDILVNFGDGFDDAIHHTAPERGYTQDGQLLIHELTHAWQIANGGSEPDYYWRAAMAKLAGRSAYNYGSPGPAWSKFGLEQQATIVEEWAVGTEGRATVTPIRGRDAAPLAGMQENDPYFAYIANNIRSGLA
jgi:hypothetical protein